MNEPEYDPSSLPPAPPVQSATPQDGVRRRRQRNRAWAIMRQRNARRERLIVDDAQALAAIWGQEVTMGRVKVTDGRPGSLLRSVRKEGERIAVQVRRFFEETEGYALVERELRELYGLEPMGAVVETMWELWEPWPREERVTVGVFMARVQARLPYEFLGPWEGLCEAELDELRVAEIANAKADLEEDAEVDAGADPEGRLLPGMKREAL